MDRLPYPPAHAVAKTIAQHFRRHVERAGIPSEVPDAVTIERIINAAFWASLRREEGREPTISLAYLPPDAAGRYASEIDGSRPSSRRRLAQKAALMIRSIVTASGTSLGMPARSTWRRKCCAMVLATA